MLFWFTGATPGVCVGADTAVVVTSAVPGGAVPGGDPEDGGVVLPGAAVGAGVPVVYART